MKKTLAEFAVLLFMASIVAMSEFQYAASIQPTGVRTLSDHILRFGNPRLIYRVARNEATFFELRGFPGGSRPLLAFPSSPPAYVYDANGLLIDWCADPGDDPTHATKWPRQSNTPIDFQTLLKQLQL